MILTRSPYYKSVPWNRPSDSENANSYKLELFIWEGLLLDVPVEPTYTVTKENLELSTDTDKVDIARLIDDFINPVTNPSTTTGVSSGNGAVWVKSQIVYYTDVDTSTELEDTDYAVRGYGYGFEGENYEPVKAILTDTTEVDAYSGGIVKIPVEATKYSGNVTVISYPNNYINTLYPLEQNQQSSRTLAILTINCQDAVNERYIEVVNGDESYTIFINDECKHTPIDVEFINRFGGNQTMTFFKEKREGLSVSSSEYESSNGQPSNGIHQFKKYNTNGRSNFSAETGYINELQNGLVKELMLSERVWVGGIPVNVKTSDIQYKNRVNDKVVNYTFNFDYSYNEINTL